MAKSLKKCIQTLIQAGELSNDLAADVQEAVSMLVKEGYTAKDASIAAVNDMIHELQSELADIYQQVGITVSDPLISGATPEDTVIAEANQPATIQEEQKPEPEAEEVTTPKEEAAPEEPVKPQEPTTDAKGNPIYKTGDRVEYIAGEYAGRHGEVSNVSPVTMRTVVLFSGDQGTSETIYYYRVSTDNGAEYMASPEEIKYETAKPANVVADIFIGGEHQDPARVIRTIVYAKKSAENLRAKAQRARKASSIEDSKRGAERQDKLAADYQAAFDAWAAKYPAEAEKLVGPAKKPEQQLQEQSGDALKDSGLKVTKTTTKNGKPVWEVGGNTREHSDMLKKAGGRWYGPKKVWSFYNDDPTAAINAKLFTPEKRYIAENKAKAIGKQDFTGRTIYELPDGRRFTWSHTDKPLFDDANARHETSEERFVREAKIMGKPVIEMSDTALENFAKQDNQAGEVARGELAKRDEADETDLGALFDEVLAEETGKVGAGGTAQKERWENYRIRGSARAGRWVVESDPRASDGYRESLAEFGFEDGQLKKLDRYYQNIEINQGVDKAIDKWAQSHQPRSAGEAAKSAAINTGKGLTDAIDGLGKLFGSNGSRLSSGLTFDEETYAKAKPLFSQAIAHFKDAGQDLKEAMRAVVRMVLDKFGPQVTENMKPYVVRFMEDVKSGNVGYDDNQEAQSDANDAGREGTAGEGSRIDGAVGADGETGQGFGGPVEAGNRAADRGDGAGRAGRGESLDAMAQENEGAGSGREANRGDRVGSGAVAEGEGVRGTESMGGGDRESADGRDRSKPPATGTVSQTNKAPSIEGVSVSGQSDFQISEEDKLGEGGQKTKARNNIAAIKLLKKLEAEDRKATPQEQKTLAKYVGWGGIKQVFDDAKEDWTKERNDLKSLLTSEEFAAARRSMLDAHYTSTDVVTGMWSAAHHLGFKGGRVLEPSVGVGNFFGLMPADVRAHSEMFGVELDRITAMLAKNLYPSATIANMGFQDVELPSGSFDFVIGNPPFGDQTLFDKNHTDLRSFNIHQFFFAKALDKLRPGGVMQMVVSRYLMDATDTKGFEARRYLGQRAKLLGAIRLPYNAFLGNANTEVVTDIIYLQKLQDGEVGNLADWEETGKVSGQNKQGESFEFNVNRYFVQHPEMVIGDHSATGKMRAANQYNVEPKADESLFDGLGRAIGYLPRDVMTQASKPLAEIMTKASDVPEGTKVFGYYMAGGNVMQRTEDKMGTRQGVPVEFKDEKAPLRAAGMIRVRDALRKLMRAELDDANDATLKSLRSQLNTVYDEYQKKYGYINQPANRRAFRDDPDLPLLESLEPGFDAGLGAEAAKKREEKPRKPSAKKADIFSKRVLAPYHEVTKADSAQDALIASLNMRGEIDPEYMSELYGHSWDEISAELGDMIFHNPNGGWQMADAYLSGNVKAKLKLAEEVAGKDPQYQRNVEALRAVIPPDVPALKIAVRLGSPWVPGDVMGQFATELWGAKDPKIRFVKQVAKWAVSADSGDETARKATWGVTYQSLRGYPSTFASDSILEFVANNKAIVIKENVGSSEQPDWRTNEPATEAVRAKAQEMRDKFREWIWQDETRRDQLAKIYNETYNTDRRRVYDGSHLTLPGSSPLIKLRAHQLNAVWRAIQDRVVLLDHVVGAGKTFEMAAIAMELRRMGITRKPMFAVPNSLVKQWRDEFYKLYPNTNVLAATEADFTKANRKRFMAKIATGDWDAVIVAHSSFKKIGMPAETEQKILKEQLDDITDAIEDMKRERGDKNVVRDMERIKIKLEERMKGLKESGRKKDDTVSFDELGVDGLFVDEAHLFKNLFYYSQMRAVAGLGNPNGSGRAFDLFVKTQYLNQRHAGKALIGFATGTPVSNSLVEMFTMQRYLAWNKLKDNGLHLLDAWAGVYGDVQNVYEVHPSGTGYRLLTRFAKFVNLPSLMELYRSFADVITMDDLKSQAKAAGGVFPVPKIKGGKPRNIVAERSDLQQRFFGEPEFGRTPEGDIQFKQPADLFVKQSDKDGKWYPWLKGGSHVGEGFDTEAEATEERDALIRLPVVAWNNGSILWKFENLKQLNKETKGKINALSITNEARKAGLDYRLVDPAAPDFSGSKINLAIAEITRIHKEWSADKGAQLVFCDLSVPKSARMSAALKERTAYVRASDGSLVEVKATAVTIEGIEQSFLAVKRGKGDTAQVDLFDGFSGAPLTLHGHTKAEAVKDLKERIEKDGLGWLEDLQDRYGEITDADIADYKDAKGGEEETEEGDDAISVSELMALAGGNTFSVYDDIKKKLVAKGIPDNEVAFIHDYDTAVKKNELFKKVRAGEIRVLLGSTEKMGAGMNVQERLVALHHLDAPWRPSDLEQREGRIVRQGNELYKRDPDGFEVEILRYGTRQTYDTRMWQIIEHKAAGVEQLRKAGDDLLEIDDIGGEAANAADMKAAASGNPLILEEIKLRNDVKSLDAQQFAHIQARVSLQDKAKWYRGAPKRADDRIAEIQPFIDAAKSNPADPFKFEIGGKTLAEKKDIATPLTVAFTESAKSMLGDRTASGVYRGVTLELVKTPYGINLIGKIGTTKIPLSSYGIEDKFSPSGLLQRVDNSLDRLEQDAKAERAKATEALTQVPKLEAEIAKPFAKEVELKEARAKHRAVVSKLQKSGGGIELTKAMKAELAKALKQRGIEDKEDGEAPLFSRLESPIDGGISVDSVREATNQLLDGLKNSPRLEVVLSHSDLPFKAPSDTRGVYRRGVLWMVAGGIRSAEDVREVTFHELTHFGLRGFFGNKLDDALDAIHSANPRIRMMAAGWRNKNTDLIADLKSEYGLSDSDIHYISIDEALANVAQHGETIHGWKRFAATLQILLRKIGLVRLANALEARTDAEALVMLKKAELFSKRGWTAERRYMPDPAYPLFMSGNIAPPIPNNAQQPIDLKGGQAGEQPWNIPEDSWFSQKIYKYQNKHVDLKDTIKAISDTGQQIRDAYNPYLQEELYHKRTAKRTSDFFENEFKPLLEAMLEQGVTREAFEEYLHARHAKEANQLIRDRGGMADGGSGMTDQEADDYFAKLSHDDRKTYETLARRIDTILAKTRATLVHYGLESKETVDSWAKMFQHYVPLHREDMAEGSGIGQGFSVKGPASKHRTGSSRKVADILANIAQQRDRAIVRGEKNRVAVALYGLAYTNPNTDVWTVDKAPQKQTLDKKGQITSAIDPLYKSRPNVMVARIKGRDGRVHDRAVVFNEHDERAIRMVEALKNLDAPHLEGWIAVSGTITRYIASMSTQYNPVFVAVNFARDFQSVALNLSSTPLKGMQKDVVAHALSALRGIYADLRDHRAGRTPTSKWAGLYEEMQLEGGTTGYRDMFANANERTAEQVEKLLDPDWWAKTGWGKVVSAGGILRAPEQWLVSKPGAAMMNWLSDLNETAENAMRLAVYKTAIDHGLSKQQAASLSKNISVNFNRKGQVGAQANALYAFFNAAVQGTARLAETMNGPAGRKIMMGGILLGVMQSLMMAAAGFGDDDPPDFVRERSLVLPLGLVDRLMGKSSKDARKDYISIPMPLGFHVIPNIGRITSDLAMRGFKKPGKAIGELLGVIAEAFNPIGSAGVSLQTLMPTPLDPFAALSENKDWTGKTIYKKDFNFNDPTPGHTRAKDTASMFSKWISEGLNRVSGGTEYTPGWMSPTPDQIDYLIGQATGGVGREVLKAWQAGESIVTGEELPAHKRPLIGRFYGKAEGQAHESSAFYENLREINIHKNEIEGRRKDGKPVDDYLAENPEARLYAAASMAEKRVGFLRRQKRKMIEQDAPREEIKNQEEKITAVMKALNDRVKEVAAE